MVSWVVLAKPALLAEQALNGSTSLFLERLFSVTSLLVYVVLLTLLARPLFVPAKRLPAFYLLCGSVAAFSSADLVFGAAISGTYEAYAPGNLFYVGVLFSGVLLGAAALHPSMAPLSEPAPEAPATLTWWRLVFLTGATLMAPGVLAIQAALGQPIDVPLIVGSSAVLFLLVAARLASMIGERKILEQRLIFRAFHDPLTHLPNRAQFMDRFERALARSGRRGGKVAVLFLDLDDFKLVNDSLGHEAGDRLLVAVADRLRASLRSADTAARLGGDEFTVLVEDVEDVEEAVRVAERILEELRTPVALREQEMVVDVSIGAALGDGTRDSPGDLLRKADLALYRAKSRGKAGYEVFNPILDERITS